MTDTPPLDLDRWEADAKAHICEFYHYRERILALISELRMAKEGMFMWQNASMKLNERLASAEEALKFYVNPRNYESSFSHDGCSTAVDQEEGKKARAHFQRYEEKE